jgi:23S rRNA (cytosine1962-C5)-methyltransferase
MVLEILKTAIQLRRTLHAFEASEALRIFYGPGETEHPELRHIAIDQFRDHFWITQWKPISPSTLKSIEASLKTEFVGKIEAIVLMDRSEIASDADVAPLFGVPTQGRFTIHENGVPYRVQMTATKHPGLFLDHAPLRAWLKTTQNEATVLNLFAYTGSLSVAAGVSGAKKVTTLDLSKSTVDWARENWIHAGLPEDRADFIYGDVFEWLPKLEKRGALYDTILCDPPSFSRSKNGTFSTQKDLARLHAAILPLLKNGGILVTSINSENHSERNFLKDIEAAALKTKCSLTVLSRIDLPPTFPTGMNLQERYLKGFYLLKTENRH